MTGRNVYFGDYLHKPRLCSLLREREKAWMLAAKLVSLQRELEALLDRGFYVGKSYNLRAEVADITKCFPQLTGEQRVAVHAFHDGKILAA